MKRMLINATQEEELRMAMVDGQRLYDLNIELPSGERKKANIYKGEITRIEPSLEAAFVNYGADRHGFLPLKEISSEYFVSDIEPGNKPNIREVLKEGQDIVVQIDKEERGTKGAALTTFVSLAGRFVVLKPNKPRSGGVSRRIIGEDRDLARQSLHDVSIPQGMSVILRTAGLDRSAEELEWDLDNLLTVWEAIKQVVVERPSPFLIYRESNAIVRALRDYLTNDIGEILVDDEDTYEEAREFVSQMMPHNLKKLRHYTDAVPLFTRYQIESQIESAFAHAVTLPSGGSLVIDHTEALVSIDINSARATKGGDIEATALNTNLEAADEVARQLRLRDLGGLVVIDFIDMGPQRNQREVENRLRDAVRQDRARVQIGKITRFGLLEMSRQRLRPSLGESSYMVCPRCSGIGNIRSVESLALAILRIIGEEARKERTAKVVAQLPVEVATYLLNEKRDWVRNLESRNDTQVILVANPSLETPHYQVRRVRDDQVDLPENAGLSYTLVEEAAEDEVPLNLQEPKPVEAAAIATVTPATPAPPSRKAKRPGRSLWAAFKSIFSASEETKKRKDQKRRADRRKGRGKPDKRRRSSQSKRRKSDGQRQADNRGSQNRGKSGDSQRKKSGKPGRDRPEQQARNATESRADKRDEDRQEGRKPGSKRRSRGGRRRRRAQDSNEKSEAKATGQSEGGKAAASGKRADPVSPAAQEDIKPAVAAKPDDLRKSSPPQATPHARADAGSAKPAAGAATPGFADTHPELPAFNKAGNDAEKSVDKTVPMRRTEAEPAQETPPQQTDKTVPMRRAEAEPAEQATPAAADKTVPMRRDKFAAEGDGSSKGRLLPWEPERPADNADTGNEELSDR